MSTSLHFLLFFSLLLSPSFSLADTTATATTPQTTPVTPTAACNSTSDPTFCKSVLPPQGSQPLSTYSLFSLSKSLSNAHKFQTLVAHYLSHHSSLSLPAVRALQDCLLLSGLNVDFLTSTASALNSSTQLLDPQTEELQTLLSALITNQQTCLDGLQATASAWSVRKGLSVPLSNGTKLYSVSLALFNHAWVPKSKVKKQPKKPKHPPMVNTLSRRMMEEEGGEEDAVQVSDVVVVSKDGSGNFSTIADAVNSAPNSTDGVFNGYYLIYVNEGVYEEYVVIPKYKKYVMMIGDGINRTVITGSHNNADLWTTFNSATFGN